MKFLAPLFSLALALLSSLAAHANTITFSAAGNGFESSGTMTVVADPTTPGTLDVTGVSGEVNGVTITGLLPGSYNANAPSFNAAGTIMYDNLYYVTSPVFDYNGIGLNIGNSGSQGNFYYDQGGYQFLDINDNVVDLTSFTVTETPEPSTLVLLGTGIVGLAFTFARRSATSPGLG